MGGESEEAKRKKHLAWERTQWEENYAACTVECKELDGLASFIRLQNAPLLQSMFIHIVELHRLRQPASDQMAHHYLHGWITEICHLKTNEIYDRRIQQLIEWMDAGTLVFSATPPGRNIAISKRRNSMNCLKK